MSEKKEEEKGRNAAITFGFQSDLKREMASSISFDALFINSFVFNFLRDELRSIIEKCRGSHPYVNDIRRLGATKCLDFVSRSNFWWVTLLVLAHSNNN